MIGSAEPRLGGERLASGAGRFVADVRVPGMLEAVVLRSRYAHARLGRIDASRALALPGVRAVLTAADVTDKAVIPHRVAAPDGTARYLQPAIARGVVRYAGEPIALVIAEDRYVAVDALALIDVAYEPLPVCATVEAALAPGAPRLFANTDSNNGAVIRIGVGEQPGRAGRQRRLHCRAHGQRFVRHIDQSESVDRDVAVLGDHERDRLAGVAHDAARDGRL